MADTAEQQTTETTETEDRAAPATGSLRVEDRVAVTNEPPRGLADEFRAAGWPAETAVIDWDK